MMRIGAAGLAAVIVWAGTSAVLAAQTASPTHDDKAVVNGAPNTQTTGKRPMTFADLMAMKRVSDPQISPSGKWVLFTVMDVDLAKNTKTNHLWVVPIDGSAPERQMTSGTGESFGRFSPDGTRMSYTQMPAKDEAYARIAVGAWDEKTGTISSTKTLTGVSGDADGAVWSPDSRHFLFTTEVYPECSVVSPTSQNRDVGHPNPTHDGEAVVNGAPDIEISGTNNVAEWKSAQPATWAEEDACDKAKDEAAGKNPVKAQVWDGLLYRHWDQYTGAKRTHILVADLLMVGDGGLGAFPPTSQNRDVGHPSGLVNVIRDVTTARDVGDAETPTWFLGGPQEYAWAPDSKEIAYVTNLDPVPAASTNNDVFTLRLDDPRAKPVKVSTSPGSDDEPEYSLDGKWLAFRSQKQAGFESDRERLMLVERVSKSASQQVSGREWSEPKELMPRFDRCVDEFVWSSDAKTIYFAAGNHGSEPIFSIGSDGKGLSWRTHVGTASKTVDDIEWGEYGELCASADGKLLVATRMTVSRPSEIYLMRLGIDSGVNVDDFGYAMPGYKPPAPGTIESADYSMYKLEQLTHLNQAVLDSYDYWGKDFHSEPPMESFEFPSADGTKVQGFIVRPPGFDDSKKYPVKFLMHGGPQTAWGDAWSYRWNWELMAASGYVVIGINRRGSTGYGQKFVDEVSGDWGGRAFEDLMKGLDYAEANFPFIDKTRECALGASYGGYMADWVLTHTNRFQCIVTHDGMYDAMAAYGSTEEMWFNEWEFRRPEDYPKGWDGFSGGYQPLTGKEADSSAALRNDKEIGGTTPTSQNRDVGHPAEPWRYAALPANEDPFRKWSPKEYIQNARTPTLIIHSQRDYRLDVSQGFELYTALQRRGVPSRFLYFPDEGHWVLKPRDSELWNAVVSDWCDRWTHSGKYAER